MRSPAFSVWQGEAQLLVLRVTWTPVQENVVPDLQGSIYEAETDLAVGMVVCVFCNEKKSRPWLGEVKAIYPDKLEFLIHWYKVIQYGSKSSNSWALI